MYFMLRCAFWIALVFLVVPMVTGPRTPAPTAAPDAAAPAAGLPGPAEVAAGSALGALVQHALAPSDAPAPPVAPGPDVAVLSDIVRFCGANGEVCAAGFSAIETLGAALGHGLTLIAGLTAADEPAARIVTTTSVSALPAVPPATGTLTADDVAEPWRGTAAAVVAGSQAKLRLPPPDPRR